MGKFFFKYRNLTGIPFFILVLFFSNPTVLTIVLSLPFFIIGETIRIKSVCHSGPTTRSKELTAPELAVTGPYAYVRNPIYIGNFFIGLGGMIALFPNYILFGLYGLLFWFQYTLIIFAEEKFLEEKFKGRYTDYKEKVPGFLPRLSPYRSKENPFAPLSVFKVIPFEKGTLLGIGVFLAFTGIWVAIREFRF